VVHRFPDENRCCQEIQQLQDKMAEFESDYHDHLEWITKHPGFASVCLDVWVLQTAYLQYRQQYNQRLQEQKTIEE
jgi:hypothetical protein